MIIPAQQELYTKFESLVIAHTIFDEMHTQICNDLEFESMGRMLAIVGAGGCGKSSLVYKLARHFSTKEKLNDTNAPSPYIDTVIFGCPSPTKYVNYWIMFLDELLELLCGSLTSDFSNRQRVGPRDERFSEYFPRDSDKFSTLKRKLRLALQYRRVKKLFLDESAHILRAVGPQEFVNQLDFLKVYCDQLGIDIVLSGPPEFLAIQEINGQLSWRITIKPFPTYALSIYAHLVELSSIVSRFQMELAKFGITGADKYEDLIVQASAGDIGVIKKCFLRLTEMLCPAGRGVVTEKDIKSALKTDKQYNSILAEINMMRGEFGDNPLNFTINKASEKQIKRSSNRVGRRNPTRDPLGQRT